MATDDAKISGPRDTGVIRRVVIISVVMVLLVAAGVVLVRQCDISGVKLRRWGWRLRGVRIHTVDKTLINDGRQVSSAFNQYCSDHSVTRVRPGELTGLLSGGKLSPSVSLSVDGVNFTNNLHASSGELAAGGFFYLRHPNFNRSESEYAVVRAAGGDEHTLKFSVDTGAPVP